MTVQKLFGICQNLSFVSFFVIKDSCNEVVACGSYMDIVFDYGDRKVLFFNVENDRDITVIVEDPANV